MAKQTNPTTPANPQEQSADYRMIIVGVGELILFYLSLHYARLWDIMHNKVQVWDPYDLQMMYSGKSRDPATILYLSTNEAFSKYFYRLNGVSIVTTFKVLLVFSGIFIAILFLCGFFKNDNAWTFGSHGTAKFNDDIKGYTKRFVTPYTDEDRANGIADPNILLGKGLKLSLVGDGIAHTDKRNANVLVIGGSGSGKTFSYVKPNIIQYNASIICTDPSGEIMAATGKGLLKNGYELLLFSTSDMLHSYVFNPLDYIYTYDNDGKQVIDEVAVKITVETFMKNVDESSKKGGGDPFWDKAANAFLTFAIFYLAEFMVPQDRNFYRLLKLCQLGKSEEDSKSSETALDKIVAKSRKLNPNAKCFVSYDTFKLAPSKTANSILITLGVNLNPFGSADKLRNMTTTDYMCKRDPETGEITEFIKDNKGNPIPTSKNIDLRTLGDKKTALFINIPQAQGAYNFLVAMLYSTMFTSLYDKAEKICPNRWHIHDRTNFVIGSNYISPEEAERYRVLYANAELKEETDSEGAKRYYIFNKEATIDETLKEKAYLPAGEGGGIGYLREMHDKEYALKFINLFKDAKIKRGDLHLPVPVRAIIDEFANVGEIKDFNKILATCRKYWLSISIIIQSLAQIKDMYEKLFEGLIGNCDSLVFLGSSENETDEYLSKKLGNMTIRVKSDSESAKSTSHSYQYSQRALMYADEIGKINNAYSVVVIRGVDPFYVEKNDYLHHPNIEDTGDGSNRDNKIDGVFLDQYFTCSDKRTKKKKQVQVETENDKKTMNGGNADGIHDNTGRTPRKIDSVEKLKESVDKEKKMKGDDLGTVTRPPDPADRKVTDTSNNMGINSDEEARPGKRRGRRRKPADDSGPVKTPSPDAPPDQPESSYDPTAGASGPDFAGPDMAPPDIAGPTGPDTPDGSGNNWFNEDDQ